MSLDLSEPLEGAVGWASAINLNFSSIKLAFNALESTVGGLAGLEFVASHTQTGGAVASFDITGLTGESDGVYFFVTRFVNANGGASEWFGVKPIPVNGTYNSQDFENNGAVSYGSTHTGCIVIVPAPVSGEAWAFTIFFPRASLGGQPKRRGGVSIGFVGDSTAPSSYTTLDSGDWNNTSDAITGFRFCLDSGNTQIGNGTHVSIYKARLT